MMNVEKVWRRSTGSDDALTELLQLEKFENLHSKLPFTKLKRNLLTGIYWALFITAAYICVLFFIRLWHVYLFLGVLIIFNVWIIIETWKLYKRTPSTITPSNSVKQELSNNYNAFQRWWSLQLRVSLFMYPIASVAGFIIGGVIGAGKSVEDFLYNTKMLTLLGITVLAFMPVSYLAAKWMFHHAYGKHLKRLKAILDNLS